MFRFGPFRTLLSVVALTLPSSVLAALTPQRIGTVDDSRLTTLSQKVHPAALRATDLGEAASDRVLSEMTLRFSMTVSQQTALDALLADQQNPASAKYHQWLTPEQFGAQFGLASADLTKVSSWLGSQGFTVAQVARGGTFIRFSGTVAQVDKAFHTSIRRLSLDGEPHFGNLTAPVLPTAIAAVTAGVTGLHDFHPKAHHREFLAAAPQTSTNGLMPTFTSATSGNHFIAPGDFYTIYDENSLLSSGINGTGVTIAVAGQTDIALADIAAFRTASGLSASAPAIQLYGKDPGMPSTDDLTEAELDVEWSGATAPNANILFVNATDVIDGSLTQAIDNNIAPIVTISYGTCETSVGAALLTSYNNLLKMANTQGQSVFAASGDSGATDCDYQVASATKGLAVDFPAVLPTVTGVGGTMFSEGTGTYFSSTNGTNSGSALSYIPEAVWNEDNTSSLSSGGGGASVYFTKPSWQVGTGVPADSSRDVPDVAMNAAASHDGYLICSSGFCTNGYRNSGGYLDVVGGTSVATPSFAGLMALVVQKTGTRQGNANPTIYALANSTYYGNVFHDVVTGTNASPCTTGTTGCSSGGTIGYAATAGYDRATGWGSVDAYNLVNDWSLVTAIGTTSGAAASTTTVTASPTAVTAGAAITLSASVTGASVPTGSVQFLVDSVATGSAVALTAGKAVYSLSTTSLSAGTHTVSAAYSGDASYASSKGVVIIDITSAASPDFALTPSTTTVSAKSGSAAAGITFTVAALNGFTGNVSFTSSTTSSNLNAQYTFSPNPVVITSTAASGTTTLTLDAFVSNATTTGLVPVATVHSDSKPWTAAGGGIAFAGLLMLLLPKRRRMAGLVALVVSMAAVGALGCGTGGASPSTTSVTTSTATTPGTYTINVVATGVVSGVSVTHNAVVTFVVQ